MFLRQFQGQIRYSAASSGHPGPQQVFMHAPPLYAAVRHHFLKSGSQGTGVRHMAAASQFFQEAGIALLLAPEEESSPAWDVRQQALRVRWLLPLSRPLRDWRQDKKARGASSRAPSACVRIWRANPGCGDKCAGTGAPEYRLHAGRDSHPATRQLRPRMPCGTLGKVKHPGTAPLPSRKGDVPPPALPARD